MQFEQSNDNIPADEMALAEKIASREHANALFAALPDDKRRVAIAQDVLKWLGEGKLTPEPGRYLGLAPGVTEVVNGFSCSACALGALFACAVEHGMAGGTVVANVARRWDEDGKEYEVPHSFGGNSIRTRLEAAGFSIEQLGLIECAFEGFSGVPSEAKDAAGYYDGKKDEVLQAFAFHDKHYKAGKDQFWATATPGTAQEVWRAASEAVMRAIMTNIIDNGGTFIP